MRRFFTGLCFVTFLALAPAVLGAEPHGEHATAQGASAAEHEEHAPSFDDINWIYGWLGEREGVEPSIAFRPKGMPAPFAVWILDALILYGFLFRVAKKPLREALQHRKANIMRGMEEAARMRSDAERRLEAYEQKLASIEQEVSRVRRDMREGAEAERNRILADARTRRERMEQEARQLVEQELAVAREELSSELVAEAMKAATAALKQRMRPEDQERLGEEFLAGLARRGPALALRRGRA
jgi:F0F1-type ATP synthase membrane subunit b/b'